MQPQAKVKESLAELIQKVDDLQVALNRSSMNMVAPGLADLAESIRAQLDELTNLAKRAEQGFSTLQGLVEIGQSLNSSLDSQIVLQNVMDTIILLTHAERGFLMLRDNQGGLSTRIARNWIQDSIYENEAQISQTIIRRVMSEGKPVMTTNANEDPRFIHQKSVVAYKLRSILCVPLMIKNVIVGVIYTDHRIQTGVFTTADKDTLMAFANQAAIALENARLYASIHHSLAEVTTLKNLMDSVFSSLTSGVITTDENRKIIFCNPAARQSLGIQPGQNLDRLLSMRSPELSEKLVPYLNIVQKNEENLTGLELRPRSAEKGEMNYRVSVSPLRDPREKKVRGLTIVMEDQTENLRLKAQQRLFERMVSPMVIQQLDPDSIRLGGSRALISVLFADLTGFTTLGETVSPETLVSVVNCYLSAAGEAVLELGGTIDKYLGDSVMAWFNAPIPVEDHAARAIRAAWKIRESLPAIHCQLPVEFRLEFSIGIHTGEAILGMIGSEKRMEYTAVGDCVNIAKRLQENANENQIIISESTFQQVDGLVKTRKLKPLKLHGRKEAIQVYEVLEILGE
jgi:adenylate cyclase